MRLQAARPPPGSKIRVQQSGHFCANRSARQKESQRVLTHGGNSMITLSPHVPALATALVTGHLVTVHAAVAGQLAAQTAGG